MADDLQLPLSALRPVEIHRLREPGLIFSTDPKRPIIAFTLWGETPTAICLAGVHAFRHFRVKEDTRCTGLFLAAPEIVVGVPSISRSESVEMQHGALLLEEGKAHILSSRLDRDGADPDAVPLWHQFELPHGRKGISFYRWSIRFTDGAEQRTVWRFDGQEVAK